MIVYGHAFSSYTWKVLIALRENGTPFEFRQLGPDAPAHGQELRQHWPIGKFPVLVDAGRAVAETSIIIEYLQLAHPGPVRLIPEAPMEALDVRFMDRCFDLHVMDAAQHAVDGALTGDPVKRSDGLALSVKKLERSYAWLETRLPDADWASGGTFTLADCAAAPALFYADWVHPIPAQYARLRAYRARLLAHPSVARTVDGARPYRKLFPLVAPDRD